MRETLFFIGGLAGAAVLTSLAVLVQHDSPFWKWALWAGIAIFAACAFILLLDLIKPGGNIVLLAGMGVGITLLVGCGIAFYFGPPTSNSSEVKTESNQNLTIQLLWRTDFNVGSYKMLQMFDTDLYTRDLQRLGRFDFGVGMYGSFESKSLFMSLYVPGSDHGYDLISWFSDGYRTYLDDARKNFHIWTAPQGDRSQPLSDNLIFTNRIYIYYENILADDQVNNLTNLYRSKGLEPVFRGFGYLEYRRLRIAAGQEKMPVDVVPSPAPEGLVLPPFVDHSPQLIDGQKLPTLLSLFMTDFKGVGGMAAQWTDIALRYGSQERKERVQFHVYNDIHKHVRFIAYYIPPSAAAFAIVKYLASHYVDQMNDLTKKVAAAKEGENVSARAAEGFAKNFPFSGTVYVYLDNSLSDTQTAELVELYKEQEADIQFRDFGYVIETWKKIKAGKAVMPPEYRLTDEFPQLVSDEKQQ